MTADIPFFGDGRTLDTDQLIAEAIPLAKLVAAIAVVALVPLLLRVLFVDALAIVPISLQWFSSLLVLATQFVLAVGTGLVLIYVIVRALRLAERDSDSRDSDVDG